MAQGEQIDIGRWTQLTNSWLGLERKARPLRKLADVRRELEQAERGAA